MNRVLALCLILVCPSVVFAADPPKTPFDWTKQTTIGDFTKELSGNLRDNVLDLGTGRVTLTPSVKFTKAEVDRVKLFLTITVGAPDQTVRFDDLVGAMGSFQSVEAGSRNINIEESPHTERFLRKGVLTLSIRNPNASVSGMKPPRPEKRDPQEYKLFPGQPSGTSAPQTILDEEKEAVASIKKIGGIVSCDEPGKGGHVVEVHFYAANLPKVKGGWRITKEDLRVIASLQHLRLLDLIHVNPPDDLLTELAPMKSLTSLELLSITDETLVVLRKANQLHTLSIAKAKNDQRPAKVDDVDAIDLSKLGTKISNKGLKELTACKNVTSLTLGGVGLTRIVMPEGLKLIGEFKELKTLKFVGQVFLTAPSIKQLGTLQNLTDLHLNTNSRDTAKLQAVLPNCKIVGQ